MRSRLFLAPGWVQGIIVGTYFGAVMAAITVLSDGEGWLSAAVGAVFEGIFYGAFMAWWTVRERLR